MRRLGSVATTILKGLFGAVVIALILFVLAVVVGIVLVEYDALFR